MATFYSPKVVTDNLSLLLDVTNTKSYPGTGTVWMDLASNLTFNSAGTTTPVETMAGVKSFAFNSSGYWYCNSGYGAVDMGGDCTLIMWLYNEGLSVRRTVFEKAGTIYASYEQEIAVTWETDNYYSYYSRWNAYDYSGGNGPVTLNAWSMNALKMSTGKTTTARTGFYSKNGGPWISNYVSRSSTAITPATDIRIGTGYAGTVDTGNIAMVLAYNKMLSDTEILQIYNATKGRFGV